MHGIDDITMWITRGKTKKSSPPGQCKRWVTASSFQLTEGLAGMQSFLLGMLPWLSYAFVLSSHSNIAAGDNIFWSNCSYWDPVRIGLEYNQYPAAAVNSFVYTTPKLGVLWDFCALHHFFAWNQSWCKWQQQRHICIVFYLVLTFLSAFSIASHFPCHSVFNTKLRAFSNNLWKVSSQ